MEQHRDVVRRDSEERCHVFARAFLEHAQRDDGFLNLAELGHARAEANLLLCARHELVRKHDFRVGTFVGLEALVWTSAKVSATFVDFTATWCPPCRALSPIVDRFAAEAWGRVRVCAVDADECPDLASRYGIRGLPTLLVFAKGREVARRMGLASEGAIRALLGG